MINKLAISFCILLVSGSAFAQVNVCLDKTGKKVFLDIACEKRGLQVSAPDFPIVTKNSVQSVYVVTAANASAPMAANQVNASQISKTNNSEKRASPWSSDVPLPGFALLFIALMPIAAALFLAFHLALFIGARLRKYRHVRSTMDN